MSEKERISKLAESLNHLTEYQLILIEKLVNQFNTEFSILERSHSSDIISDCVLKNFGDVLRLHHCFSKEPFTKDKFEFAFVKTLNFCGYTSSLAPKGNPGHDLSISNIRVSLKTQADKSIKREKLHISKFMELGKDDWGDNPDDLKNLLSSFISHMTKYDRIFTLRCLDKHPNEWEYELVEIPKNLFLEAQNGTLRMQSQSSQFPKPGYCDVFNNNQEIKFQLYFDGGSERKLQIKNLRKKYCSVHATWKFKEVDIIKKD